MRFAFLILFFPTTVFAFIDIEAVRRDAVPGFNGKSSLTASGQSGNSERVGLSFSTLNMQRFTTDDLLFLGDINYSKAAGVEDASNGRAHLRYTHLPREWLAYEYFSQTEYDRFRKLLRRDLAGANLRHRLSHSDTTSLFAGYGAFYEWEHWTEGGHHDRLRANIYASLTSKLTPTLSTAATVYYQPSFTAFSDYRLRMQSSAESTITERLAMQLQLSIDSETVRAEGVKPTDVVYSAGLSFKY